MGDADHDLDLNRDDGQSESQAPGEEELHSAIKLINSPFESIDSQTESLLDFIELTQTYDIAPSARREVLHQGVGHVVPQCGHECTVQFVALCGADRHVNGPFVPFGESECGFEVG